MFNQITSVLIILVGVAAALPRLDGGRIINGENATIAEFPYQVSVQIHNKHECGGSIISKEHILTAAHCSRSDVQWLSIRAGSTFHNAGGRVITVAEKFRHPGYNKPTLDNDIAILRLSEPLEFDANVQPISLPNLNEQVVDDSECTVTGWGIISEFDDETEILQKVNLQILNHDECREKYAGFNAITASMICTHDDGIKDACDGDSGGPLVQDGKLVGVVSWGRGCARPGSPGVFCNVAFLRAFINEVTGL